MSDVDLGSKDDEVRCPAEPPLNGVVVVDVGQIYNAPYATLLMALAGATVLKIEPPLGESVRQRNAAGTGADLAFYMLNSNKLGVSLNLTDPRGRELLIDMVERADVPVENYRPGVLNRLGLGFDVLSARNPTLIAASGSGYGQAVHIATSPRWNSASRRGPE